ncbi:MAG: FG-GAP-like repeat-containing protein [Chloroflexota bacterium]
MQKSTRTVASKWRIPAKLIPILFAGLILIALLIVGRPALAQGQPSAPPFEEVTAEVGIDAPRQGNERITGQAWADYDGDGWPDLYLTDFGAPNKLYRNNGNGTFSLSPLADQVSLPEAQSGGAVWADYDNDGWPDLYITNWGANVLYHNDEGQGFSDVTETAGVGDTTNGKSASWGDYDNDGNLDLYVANWSCTPRCGRPIEGDKDAFYHNNGDGTFTNVTNLLSRQVMGAGFIASFIDFDNDNDLDIYLINDEFVHAVGNALWRNDGPGCDGWCFTDISAEAGADQKVMGMGLAVGDYDNDLDFDLYFSNVGPMTLLQYQGDGSYLNEAEAAGVELPEAIGWGSVFLDYNNDGWTDLYLAQMTETDGGIGFNPLFHNNGDGTFTNLAESSGAADPGKTIGLATADYDRDGDIDLVIGNFDEDYKLYRNTTNDTGQAGNWVAFKLSGAGPVNRDAIGAKVYLTDSDGRTQFQQVNNGTGLGGNSLLDLHFGLGDASATGMRVVWPDGSEQTFENLHTNAHYALTYQGQPIVLSGALAHALPGWLIPAVAAILLAGLLTFVLWKSRAIGRLGEWLEQPAARRGALIAMGVLAIGALVAAFLWSSPETLALRFTSSTDGRLSLLLSKSGVTQLDPGPVPDAALVKLGEALFFDPILSGNRDTSCATCHHPHFATGDGLPLSIGTGGHGLGPDRDMGDGRVLIPRNATELFNRGSAEWTTMFWDGRVNLSDVYGLSTPVGNGLPALLDNALAAQAMFPVTSRDEMRGDFGDSDVNRQLNEIGSISDMRPKQMWSGLMKRILDEPEYVALFQNAFPDTPVEQLGFEYAATAIAAYEIDAFTFLDSPWDRYLAGDQTALTDEAKQGALLFYGEAGCAACHAGNLMTDQAFHNIGVPQLGPGKLSDDRLDLGRFLETGDHADRYAFRTPPLRNVTLTGPYMHNGAYSDLEAAVRHHLNPAGSLQSFDPQTLPPLFRDQVRMEPDIQADVLSTLDPRLAELPELTDEQVAQLMAFLNALESPSAVDLSPLVPEHVPSGLPVSD